ncbi:unnamed protein product [Adineta ricciae]|uniref:Uncharacterized protein n=1 Tax=Adineta ricciae TaxID=249248 RepID=A0A815USB3_ADIRI|nr:unnamed protein product [Adineta ricciae]
MTTYQTFSSSPMTIGLCFRLCRQSIILITANHTNCICLYTMNSLQQLREHLGQLLSVDDCTPNSLEVYSLSKNVDILPSLSSTYEWALDGCYYLHGIQIYQPNMLLTNEDYTQAISSCREHCQKIRPSGDFSFMFSLKKACYCLPITITPRTAVRKPLIHCSFLPYLKASFSNVFNYSEVHSDTAVKIDVQRYCSPTSVFDRTLSTCLKSVSIRSQNSYSRTCVPMLIDTLEQWEYVHSYPSVPNVRTFLQIDRNSSYIFQSTNTSLPVDDICVVIAPTTSNRAPSIDLVSCSTASRSDYVLCAQKPVQSNSDNETRVQNLQDEEQFPVADEISCPMHFVFFNNMCYYVYPLFVYSIQSGDEVCAGKNADSTLVKLNSHNWGNINATKFLGRTIDDILLEFFYYQLETNNAIDGRNDTSKKHWLRLLLGEKYAQNECVLRYFTRASGAFTVLHRCVDGGHPVCQCQAIRRNITKTESIEQSTVTPSDLPEIIQSVTDTLPIPFNSSISDPMPDEDLRDNETSIDYQIRSTSRYSRYRSFIIISITGLLAPVILIIGTVLVIRHVRRSRGSYSTRGPKRSSTGTTVTTDEQSSTPSVVYTKLKSSPPSTAIDIDMSNPFDDSVNIDDQIQLLPELVIQPKPSATVSSKHETESSNQK